MSQKVVGDLNDKQKLFCKEYLIDLNGTQAAIRAGYSEKTAGQQAEQLLKKLEIAAYVQELKEKRSEKTEITAEMVLRELAKIGFSNIQDYIKEGFTISEISKLNKDHAAAIESVKIKEIHGDFPATEVTFKLHDKLSALEKIAKHIGFFSEDNKQRVLGEQVFMIGGQKIQF
jgi:phage terminase small subunit